MAAGAALVGMFAMTTGLVRAYTSARAALAETYFQEGRDFTAQGRYEQAIDQYRRAISFSPADSQYRLLLAQALVETGRLAEAQAHLDELHDEDPTDAVVNLALARIYAKENDVNDAVAWYHRAIYGLWSENPQQSRINARWELIQFLAGHDERRQVIAELLQLFSEAPDDARQRLKIGRMLLGFGAVANAEEVFEDVVNTNPRFVDGWSALADAQMGDGKYAEARNSLRRAWRLAPHDGGIWNRLETVNQILALDPTLPTLTSAERFSRSRELLERCVAVIEECATTQNKTLAAQQQADIAAAQGFLQPKRRAPAEGQTPQALSLALELWQDRAQLCGSTAPDPALAAVLAMIEKQQ